VTHKTTYIICISDTLQRYKNVLMKKLFFGMQSRQGVDTLLFIFNAGVFFWHT